MALIGHPAVVLADAPDQFVDVVEGAPEVEVVKEGERFVLRVTPALRSAPAANDEPGYYYIDDSRREAEALRTITLVRESPQRLRVVRLTAAQRRAAQLVAGRLAVPASAHDELQRSPAFARRSLSGARRRRAGSARSDRRCPAARGAIASGEASQAAPRRGAARCGGSAPRCPANGRARLMAALGGETVGTTRDLRSEQGCLDAVLDALPFLEDAQADSGASG